MNDPIYTIDTLPNNLTALRTGTANDGRMLIYVGAHGAQQESALRDLRRRLPPGWTAEIYELSGIDAVITPEPDVLAALRAAGYEPEAARDGNGYYVTVEVGNDQDADAAHTALVESLPESWIVDWAGTAGDGRDEFHVHRA